MTPAITRWRRGWKAGSTAPRSPRRIPAGPLLHRLNRAEYANAIRDLLASRRGRRRRCCRRTTRRTASTTSPMCSACRRRCRSGICRRPKRSASWRVGDPSRRAGSRRRTACVRISRRISTSRACRSARWAERSCATPFRWTASTTCRCGSSGRNFGNLRGLEHPHAVEVTLDGDRVQVRRRSAATTTCAAAFDKPTETGRCHRRAVRDPRAGEGRARTRSASASSRISGSSTPRGCSRSCEVRPTRSTGPGRPHLRSRLDHRSVQRHGPGRHAEPRRQIFVCRPATPASESACARQIIATLTRRAYRQPPQRRGSRSRSWSSTSRHAATARSRRGIQSALQLILASPKFVFRVEQDPPDAPPGSIYRISDVELASRLSFFLWSSIPDDELLDGREPGHAARPRGARAAGPAHAGRSEVVAHSSTNFAGQWLQLRNLQTFLPNSDDFPDFDDNLRQAFARETELFFESVMREDRNVLDLLTRRLHASSTNGSRATTASRASTAASSAASRVTDEARRGLLGKAAFSPSRRTRPVRRPFCAASGCSRTSSARRPRRRRPTCRRSRSPSRQRPPGRCASRWRSIARTRRARAVTR